MQKRTPSRVILSIAALAFLFPCAAFGSEGKGKTPPAHPDNVTSTGSSGIYRYYDKERNEWVSGSIAPSPEPQESQGEFPLIIAPEIKLPTQGERPPLRPEPRRDPGWDAR